MLKWLKLIEQQLKSTDTILTKLEEHFAPEKTFFMNNIYFIHSDKGMFYTTVEHMYNSAFIVLH